jgi:hypothetical protein
MSIVTLKRKTDTKYNNMSVGSKTGFSLNGTHRSQGYVGQTMLSRSLPRTLMKGNVAKGHGGCCGSYPQHGIIQSAITNLNDPSVIKSSVINTAGMIRTHYRWIWRPQPYSSTKTDSFHNSNPQSNYIKNLSTNTFKKVDESNILSNTDSSSNICPNFPIEALPTSNQCNITKTNISRPERNNPLLCISGGSHVNPIYSQQEYMNIINARQTVCTNTEETSFKCTVKPSVNSQLNKTPLIGGTKTY